MDRTFSENIAKNKRLRIFIKLGHFTSLRLEVLSLAIFQSHINNLGHINLTFNIVIFNKMIALG